MATLDRHCKQKTSCSRDIQLSRYKLPYLAWQIIPDNGTHPNTTGTLPDHPLIYRALLHPSSFNLRESCPRPSPRTPALCTTSHIYTLRLLSNHSLERHTSQCSRVRQYEYKLRDLHRNISGNFLSSSPRSEHW